MAYWVCLPHFQEKQNISAYKISPLNMTEVDHTLVRFMLLIVAPIQISIKPVRGWLQVRGCWKHKES